MPTSKPPLSGRGARGSIDKQDKYLKNSLKTSYGNYMTTFSRTKLSQIITTWNDDHYFCIAANTYLKFLADASGDVDSATVVDPGFLSLLDIVWELYYTNANLKDLEATEEASWKLYTAVACQILVDLQIMYTTRTMMPAVTESNTTPGSGSAVPYFDQDSFDTLVTSFKDFPMPALAIELAQIFSGWIVKLSEPYEAHTIRIPSSHFIPFSSWYDLEDYEAMRDLLRVNLGGFITHGKKFGLKTGAVPTLKAPEVRDLTHSDVIAYFNHASFSFYDNTPGTEHVYPDGGFQGTNLTTDYTNVEYIFKDNPNESKLHVLAPWFGVYDATNNPYGGIVTYGAVSAAEYRTGFLIGHQHDSIITAVQNITNIGFILQLYKAWWDGNSAVFQVSAGGTNFTAVQQITEIWPLAIMNRCFFGTNRPAVAVNNDMLNFIGRICV